MMKRPVEHWILHYEAHYDAVPWPFRKSWDEFVRSPAPLVNPCDDFGRVSPSDGVSEMPSVPAHLPRCRPRGTYRMAIYHDANWLYAFLEAENGPIIVSTSEIERIPRFKGVHRTYPALALLSSDHYFVYQFGVDANGKKTARVGPAVQGARQKAPTPRKLQWDFALIPDSKGELSCWRIARESIADAFAGDSVQLALSRLCFETIEAVAWRW